MAVFRGQQELNVRPPQRPLSAFFLSAKAAWNELMMPGSLVRFQLAPRRSPIGGLRSAAEARDALACGCYV